MEMLKIGRKISRNARVRKGHDICVVVAVYRSIGTLLYVINILNYTTVFKGVRKCRFFVLFDPTANTVIAPPPT
jgi:hypothetical protein